MVPNSPGRDAVTVWREFLRGDRDAFAYMYQANIDFLYTYGMKIVPDSALVKDCIQDLFVELWQNKAKLGETTSIKFYLYTSLKRKLIREQGAKRKPEAHSYEITLHLELGSVLPHDLVIVEGQRLEELQESLAKAIAELTNRQQEALHLKFYEGLTNDQIAAVLEVNPQSVYNLIHQALRVLRKSYQV
ncbi:sigma-70 family RNA polymerase sigma factor [soil metagenome]